MSWRSLFERIVKVAGWVAGAWIVVSTVVFGFPILLIAGLSPGRAAAGALGVGVVNLLIIRFRPRRNDHLLDGGGHDTSNDGGLFGLFED